MINKNNVNIFNKKLIDFCAKHKKIYLYGAGTYGKIFFDYFAFAAAFLAALWFRHMTQSGPAMHSEE